MRSRPRPRSGRRSTHDPTVNSRLIYQLSYSGLKVAFTRHQKPTASNGDLSLQCRFDVRDVRRFPELTAGWVGEDLFPPLSC